MPCCWPPTASAATSSSPPAAAAAAVKASRPGPRGDLGAVGVRGAARPHAAAGVGVADDDLAGLGRGVDPRDEGHRAAAGCREREGHAADPSDDRAACVAGV